MPLFSYTHVNEIIQMSQVKWIPWTLNKFGKIPAAASDFSQVRTTYDLRCALLHVWKIITHCWTCARKWAKKHVFLVSGKCVSFFCFFSFFSVKDKSISKVICLCISRYSSVNLVACFMGYNRYMNILAFLCQRISGAALYTFLILAKHIGAISIPLSFELPYIWYLFFSHCSSLPAQICCCSHNIKWTKRKIRTVNSIIMIEIYQTPTQQ